MREPRKKARVRKKQRWKWNRELENEKKHLTSRPTTTMNWSVGFRSSLVLSIVLMWSSLCVHIFIYIYIFWTLNKTVHIPSFIFFHSLDLFSASSFFSSSPKWFTGIHLLCLHIIFFTHTHTERKYAEHWKSSIQWAHCQCFYHIPLRLFHYTLFLCLHLKHFFCAMENCLHSNFHFGVKFNLWWKTNGFVHAKEKTVQKISHFYVFILIRTFQKQ